MTTLIVTVDDERTESLKKILNDILYVHSIEIKSHIEESKPFTQAQRIKAILSTAKGKNLLGDIKDPVAWQREIRNNLY